MAEENPIDSTEPAVTESGSEKSRIGLCLSGGGFRASFFHLGTLRYLEEAGIMEKVEVVSTVSGGSIIGAYYLVQMERKIRAHKNLDRLEACDEIIREFTEQVQKNLRMKALVFYPFFHPLLTILRLLRLRHLGDTMAMQFEKCFFSPRLRIGDLPVQSCNGLRGPRALINTTSLVTGLRVVYSRESDSGLKAQLEKSDPNDIRLARVVGASASVPGLFKPLQIGGDVLVDGGGVDNQGLESLFDYFEISDEEMNLLPRAFRQNPQSKSSTVPISFIISDGSGQFSVKEVKKATRSGSASRSMAVLQAANRRKILKILLESHEDQSLETFAFTHLALNLKGSVEDRVGDDRLPSELIVPTAEIRTDLDEFSLIERDALIYHGYTLMKNRVEKYCGELPEESTVGQLESPPNSHDDLFCWPPRFVELVNPAGGFRQRATESREKLAEFLGVGQSLIFRDFQRFPGFFGIILAIFVALGLAFSCILLLSPVKDWLHNSVMDTIAAVIPAYDLILFDLSWVERAFSENGEFSGAIELIVSVVCIAIGFYVSLFLYWKVKRILRLSEWKERRLLSRLTAIEKSETS